MIVLALDTCFGACSAAAGMHHAGGVEVLASRYEERAQGHAEALFPMIDAICAQVRERTKLASFQLKDIEFVAVTHGPGTFTGVRIAVAAARGLSLALNVPIVSVSSLALIAFAARKHLAVAAHRGDIVVAMQAGRDQLYVQLFGHDASALTEPVVLALEEARLFVLRDGTALVGTGATALANFLTARGRCTGPVLSDWQPDAAHLIALTHGVAPRTSPLVPLYVRAPDAKPQADKSIARMGP